jgi:hypothetical protein
VISLELYQQTYTYDTGNNLTALSHRGSSADIKGIFGFKYRRISSPLFFSFIEVVLRLKNSNTWQQTLIIHPNNNRGTETQQSTSDFDVNGNLLTLDNIGTLNFVFTCNDGSATIGVVVFVTESLGFVIQL